MQGNRQPHFDPPPETIRAIQGSGNQLEHNVYPRNEFQDNR
jgi:hypothetical protein